MKKIISFMHLSLDGFVAGPNGEMERVTELKLYGGQVILQTVGVTRELFFEDAFNWLVH